MTGQDFADSDVQKRLLESFAAGFGVGGTIGAGANLRRGPINKQPTNLLNPSQTTEPPTSDSREATPVGSPTPSGGMGARPDFVAGAEGVRASTPGDRIYTGEVQPNQFGGAQGVIDLGGIPVAEAKARSMQGNVRPQQVWDVTTQSFRDVNPQEQAAQVGPQQPYSDPNQLALQFAPPAPSGVGFTDQAAPIANPAMQQAMNLAQSREAQVQAQAAAAAQREADLNKLQARGQAQRQLDIAQQAMDAARAQQQQTQQQLPTKPLPIRQPQQLELFSRREAPRPSRAEGLRRGVGTQLPEPTTPVLPVQDLRRSPQVPLFTQQGAPSMAALRSAGTQQQVVPTVQQGATQIAPTGAPVTAVTSEAAKGAALKKEKTGTITFEDGSVYTGQLKKGVPNGQGTLIYSDTSTYTGQFKDGKPHGTGRFEDADGTVFDGQFDDGDFLQPEAQGEPDATQEGKQQQGRQPKRQQDNAGVQGGRKAGQQPKTQEQGGGTEASGSGKSLKRGAKQAEVTTATEPTEPTEPTPPKGGKKT